MKNKGKEGQSEDSLKVAIFNTSARSKGENCQKGQNGSKKSNRGGYSLQKLKFKKNMTVSLNWELWYLLPS